MHATSVLFVLAVTACGGGDASPPDALPPPVDVALDAALPTNLVGVWLRIPSEVGDPPAEPERLHLKADGTFLVEEDGDDDVGTWTATDQTLTIVGATSTITVPYVLAGARLVLPAFRPVGAVQGTVGTWRSAMTENGKTTTQTVELRADMTAAIHYDDETPTTYQGTWSYDEADIVFTTMVETTTLRLHFQEIRGVALGRLFERQP